MLKRSIAAAAAAFCLFAAPSPTKAMPVSPLAAPASLVQQAQVSIDLGGRGPAVRIGPRDRRYYDRRWRRGGPRCRWVQIRERRGNRTIIRNVRRCR